MTEMLFVRHAQASFGAENYDALSPVGHEQARRLGAWLADHYEDFDVVATGAMVRHRETLHGVAESWRQRARAWREPVELEGMNEFDHKAVLEAFQANAPSHPAVEAMARGTADPRTVYEYLKLGFLTWSTGALDPHLAEGWHAFSDRVARGVADLGKRCAGARRVLVVTSGGVIAQVARLALKLSPASTIDLNLSVRNSAMCEFRHTGEALLLSSWNSAPHLAAPGDRSMWTHY